LSTMEWTHILKSMLEWGTALVIIFFLELLLLYLSSRLLTGALTRLIHSLTHSQTKTIHILAFLFLPGTVVHELAHIITAGAMLVHVGNIEFLPEIRENEVKLGSAEIGRTDPIRRGIIGIAPVLVGITLLVGMLLYFFSHFSQFSSVGWVMLLIYALFVLSNTMFSSKKDMEGFLVFLGLIIGLVVAVEVTSLVSLKDLAQRIFSSDVVELLKKVDLTLLIPIVVDLMIYLLVKFTLRGR
jgi:hypothetical protein